MKPLNKRKQNLRTAGEIMNNCACRVHPCSCAGHTYDVHIDTREALYVSANHMAIRGGGPTSVSKI